MINVAFTNVDSNGSMAGRCLRKLRSRRRRRTLSVILVDFGNLPRRRITYRCGYGGPELGPCGMRGGGDWQNSGPRATSGPRDSLTTSY